MTTPATVHQDAHGGGPDRRPILGEVLRSEWTKLISVRSTYWTLFVAALAMVGLSALLCATYVNRFAHLSASDRFDFHATSFSLNGLLLAQLAIGVLGVLIITSEYSTGMIRSTLAAVPQRGTVLAAKAIVFTGVNLVVGEISAFAAFFVGQSILSSSHIEAHLGDPGVARAVIGAGLYLAVLGLLALGLGSLIRHSAGAIAALFGLILVLPGLVQTLPTSWQAVIDKYLPSNAGAAVFRTSRDFSQLSPWVGFGVFCLYAAVSLAAATVLLRHRDA